jgi:hypothetical protein
LVRECALIVFEETWSAPPAGPAVLAGNDILDRFVVCQHGDHGIAATDLSDLRCDLAGVRLIAVT